ncbi:uncharacterized protein si:dkey-181m9.8 isoform X2 [Conger conger]|uniref:uncharacterized protein si:dkey-181m9.8 isoform X2 n=1 Tax=Conger conger TaxID=82655 RepID=UPI002A5A1A1A|nr:uncharacterized protein si:dkey-181m9.8 isoform X2 [Conger conger]
MSWVNGDQAPAALTECGYTHPTEALTDIKSVTAAFKDLHLYVDDYCFSDGKTKKLLNLSGTIPIWYEGNVYDIPICIWLHNTHPQSPPKCFLRPSVAMVINPKCSYVDTKGLVLLQCLNNWQHGWSSLSIVLEEMRAAFQRETPLFSTGLHRTQTPPLAHPQSPLLSGSHKPVKFLEPYRQPVDSLPYRSPSAQHGVATSSMASSVSHLQGAGSNTLPSVTKHQQPDPSTARRVRKSYTEELLDLGITFGAPSGHSFPSTNPFTQTPLATVPNSSKTVGIDDLFTSLQLDRVSNLNKLNSNNRDAERILTQVDHVITVNQQEFPVQVNRVDALSRIPVPDGVSRDKVHVFHSLLSLEGRSFSPEEALEAAQSCRDLASALRYLSHECPICREQVSFSKIITMTHCSCAFCESCFKAYFSSVIKEKSIVGVVCPLCHRPDVREPGSMGEAMDYFNLLDTQIRHYLDPQTHELFQSKLRDHALLEMPNFRWCAHCSFGLLHEADRLRMDCPSCKKSTCSKCKSRWVSQHEGLSCEMFQKWQTENNPEFQNSRLENLLSRNKIDCPRCKFRFYLSKGGCLHFKCTQCQHEFCGGCGRTFRLGSDCGFSVDCGTKGLHAHHPRDCLYHLRDWSVPRLLLLLQRHSVPNPIQAGGPGSPEGRDPRGLCGVLEQREMEAQREEACGKPAPAEYGGYCERHYKESLVELINQKSLDPAVLFNRAELESELKRWKIRIPHAHQGGSEVGHLHRLRKAVRQIGLVAQRALVEKSGAAASASCPTLGDQWSTAPNNPVRGLPPESQLLLLLND